MNTATLIDSDLRTRFNGISVGDSAGNLRAALQHGMHVACDDRLWYAGAADRLQFQLVMDGLGLPVPELIAVTQPRLTAVACVAAQALPGIRTQSWDVALTDRGSVLLEVNYGGGLNLAQLAHGVGVLDETYTEHLRQNGYRL